MTQRSAVKYYLKVTRKRFSNNGLLVCVRRFIRWRIPRKKKAEMNPSVAGILHTLTHTLLTHSHTQRQDCWHHRNLWLHHRCCNGHLWPELGNMWHNNWHTHTPPLKGDLEIPNAGFSTGSRFLLRRKLLRQQPRCVRVFTLMADE